MNQMSRLKQSNFTKNSRHLKVVRPNPKRKSLINFVINQIVYSVILVFWGMWQSFCTIHLNL